MFDFSFLVATKRLYRRVVGPLVTLRLFGLLGAALGRVSGLVETNFIFKVNKK